MTSQKRVLIDEIALVGAEAKRAKTESTADHEQILLNRDIREDIELIVGRKRKRLQRAVSKVGTGKSSTAKKKLRPTRKTAAAENESQKSLLDIPFDILYEISSHLPPAALLSLSRVSHNLRDFYLSKSTRKIWIASLSLVNLPPCPEDLSEPQYASVMFDTNCMACNAPRIKSSNLFLRLRLCDECFDLNVIEPNSISDELAELSIYGVSPLEVDEVKVATIKYTPSVAYHRKSDSSPVFGFYRPDIQDAFLECLYHYRTCSSDDFQKFVKKQIQMKESIFKHAELLQKWMEKMRESELVNLSRSHAKSVTAKLRELGYTNDDWNIPDDFSFRKERKEWIKLAYQKRVLTDRTWKSLLPKLEAFLAAWGKRANRMRRIKEFDTAYIKYYRELQLTFGELDLVPSTYTLRREKLVEGFVFHDNSQRQITDELWMAFFPVVEELCRKHRLDSQTGHDQAVLEWRIENGREIQGLGPLEHVVLASSLFRGLSERYYFFNSINSIGEYAPNPSESATFGLDETCERWFTYSKTLNLVDPSIADALLANLHLSPTTKMLYMQELGERFICCRCGNLFKKVMGWSALLLHYTNELRTENSYKESRRRKLGIEYVKGHALEGANLTRLLTDAEVVLEIERQNAIPELPQDFRCHLCSMLRVRMSSRYMTQPQVEEHIRLIHGKEPAPEDIDVPTFWDIEI